jgi:hypothetical protein
MILPMSVEDHHFRREDRASLWLRLARHVEAHPDDLVIALENLDISKPRWGTLVFECESGSCPSHAHDAHRTDL